METNWAIIAIVIVAAIILLIYLIKKNLSDEKDVTDYFNRNEFNNGKESELDEKEQY
ncbi:hypothetical protein [Flavobacterium sp.]